MIFSITADSTPALDTWGWADYWSCQEWMQWHRLNVQAYGRDVANSKFISAWSAQDAFASPYNWCKYDSGFTNYFKQQGIDLGNIFSQVINAAGNVVDAASNVTQTASNATDVLKWALPLAVIAALIIAGMWGYKTFAK
jgi:hypothetical protein